MVNELKIKFDGNTNGVYYPNQTIARKSSIVLDMTSIQFFYSFD